jgi:phage tail sheath protein FI
MPEYLSPGVYVEEVSGGIKPIEAVGTSTGAFVGRSIKGPVNKATLITNQTQFLDTFGGFNPGYYLAYAVSHFFLEGGTKCFVSRVFKPKPTADPSVPSGVAWVTLNDKDGNPALRVFAANEGVWGNSIVIEIADIDDELNVDPDNDPKFKLLVKYKETPTSTPVTVETYAELSLKEFTAPRLPNPTHAEASINGISKYITVDDLSEDPAVFAPPAKVTADLQKGDDGDDPVANDFVGAEASKTAPVTPASGLHAFDEVDDINIVAIPDLAHNSISHGDMRDATLAGFTYCQNRKDCFFVADSPRSLSPTEALDYKQGTGAFKGQSAFNSTFGALYYPWIYVTDPRTGKRKLMPPSGAVIGTYSATDVRRGVHKAPAGIEDPLNVAVAIERIVTKGEQDLLNPKGVNVIRSFPGLGSVIWGARTVSADPEWRYVNVRRLFLMLEESIDEGTQWVVFEPNDQTLWKRIVRNITAFLLVQWREGKLVGDKPEKAFFVKCDEETNPPESVELGRVITVIGVAPSKPAEFVIFRIMQARPGSN